MNIRPFTAATALLFVASCSTSNSTGAIEESHLGEAKNMTMAAQVIDPDPQYEYLDPETNGEHAAKAVERYRKGEVKQPERVRATQPVRSGN